MHYLIKVSEFHLYSCSIKILRNEGDGEDREKGKGWWKVDSGKEREKGKDGGKWREKEEKKT